MFTIFNPLFAVAILKTNLSNLHQNYDGLYKTIYSNKSYESYTHKSMQTRINQVQTDGNKNSA